MPTSYHETRTTLPRGLSRNSKDTRTTSPHSDFIFPLMMIAIPRFAVVTRFVTFSSIGSQLALSRCTFRNVLGINGVMTATPRGLNQERHSSGERRWRRPGTVSALKASVRRSSCRPRWWRIRRSQILTRQSRFFQYAYPARDLINCGARGHPNSLTNSGSKQFPLPKDRFSIVEWQSCATIIGDTGANARIIPTSMSYFSPILLLARGRHAGQAQKSP